MNAIRLTSMKIPLYDKRYNARKAVTHWIAAFLAFGPISILLHFFTVEYDLFQGFFVATFVVLVELIAYRIGKQSETSIAANQQ